MTLASEVNKSFYCGKRVFVTGNTGFKGAWLTAILHELKAKARGYALKPEKGSLYEKIAGDQLIDNIYGDVRDGDALTTALCSFQPEIVIHLAAMATVNECYMYPRDAYETNVMGTVNLLEAVKSCENVKSVVIVTTDKVYDNKGDGAIYKETDPLGGNDPYASSKTCIEYIVNAYRHSYLQTNTRMTGVSTVRASNVLGGGDHIQTRLIPSLLQSFADGSEIKLRHPSQTRPWQSVLDALNGYLTVARKMVQSPQKYSSQWNIGPVKDGIKSVFWVVKKMQQCYHNYSDYEFANEIEVQESSTLGLDISKSLQCLGWKPEMSCAELFSEIVNFFQQQQAGVPERDICLGQVKKFYRI
ncbi:MAG: CDP-glucose 4,6-dehydratase [Oscillospiraceae bacterium]|jgi:CDP-glucose 4,6-dehydratase|nr:CDP-glucose 4,6-dehydratase [Oscillospiraceae bacterium]